MAEVRYERERRRLDLELTHGSNRARIDSTCGGRLASLCIDGEEVLVTEGSGDTEWGCYPMVPWAGRVRDGRFHWAGSDHQLPINLPPHALHGTVFGTAWEVTGPDSMRCRLGSDWPWPGEVRSVFALGADSFTWRLEVHADVDAFPVVVGWHPWFRRSVAGHGPVRFYFDPAEMHVRDAAGIPTGERVAPTPGPWDDCFSKLRSNPRLTWPGGHTVELTSSCEHWVIYDEPSHAVCVEPQSGPPDAFNLGGAEVARPGEPVVHTMRLQWGMP